MAVGPQHRADFTGSESGLRAPLPACLIKENCRSAAYVERIHTKMHRYRYRLVTCAEHFRSDSNAFTSKHDAAITREVSFVKRPFLGVWMGCDATHPIGLQPSQSGCQRFKLHYGQFEYSAH